VVVEPIERAWHSWLSTRSHTGHRNWQQFEGLVRQKGPLPKPSILHNIEQGQGQHSDAPNGVSPVWCATGARGWLPRHRMRSWRTSGSVGRAPGNRCLYPEGDCLQPTLRSGFRQQLTPSVIAPRKLGVSGRVKVPVG